MKVRTHNTLFALALIVAMLIGGCLLNKDVTVANAAKDTKYAAKGLAVRTAPDAQAEQVGTLKKGKKIKVYGTSGAYTKVKFEYEKVTGVVAEADTAEATTEVTETTEATTEVQAADATTEVAQNADEYCYVLTKYLSNTKTTGEDVVNYGKKFLGNPYRYGGTSLTHGTDCSGFVYSIYKHFGYKVGRSGYNQRTAGKKVKWSDRKPGDIIVYNGGSHVAIYMGDNKIIHASTVSTGIKISYNPKYKKITSVRRVLY